MARLRQTTVLGRHSGTWKAQSSLRWRDNNARFADLDANRLPTPYSATQEALTATRFKFAGRRLSDEGQIPSASANRASEPTSMAALDSRIVGS